MARKKTTDAVRIVYDRYIKGRPEREAAVEREETNLEIARMIYNLRTEAGLTQQQLADLIGTRQSVISRLEDADYQGQSLGMLKRIAEALNHRLKISLVPRERSA